jgi:hypothetical protein
LNFAPTHPSWRIPKKALRHHFDYFPPWLDAAARQLGFDSLKDERSRHHPRLIQRMIATRGMIRQFVVQVLLPMRDID